MSPNQTTSTKLTRRDAVVITAGVAAIGCTAIAMLGLRNTPIDAAGAPLGSKEFIAAAAWIKENNAQYCDMNPEQTLLKIAKKTVPGLLTTIESTAYVVETATGLSASTEEHQRALGLYVRVRQFGAAATEELLQLIQLAKSTSDPIVYATALRACVDAQSAACEDVNAERWTIIDGENGVAWLAAAREALERKDDAAATVAIKNAVEAKLFKARAQTVGGLMNAAAVRKLPAYNQEMVGLALLPLTQIDPMHQFGALEYCIENGKPPLDRRSLCERIAIRLANDDQTVEGLTVAEAVGRLFIADRDWLIEVKNRKRLTIANATSVGYNSDSPYLPCKGGPNQGSAASRLSVRDPLATALAELKYKPTN